jgi:hypothetical protein
MDHEKMFITYARGTEIPLPARTQEFSDEERIVIQGWAKKQNDIYQGRGVLGTIYESIAKAVGAIDIVD